MIRLIPAQGTRADYADHIIGPPFTVSTRAVKIADSLSRFQHKRFRELAPLADPNPYPIPAALLTI